MKPWSFIILALQAQSLEHGYDVGFRGDLTIDNFQNDESEIACIDQCSAGTDCSAHCGSNFACCKKNDNSSNTTSCNFGNEGCDSQFCCTRKLDCISDCGVSGDCSAVCGANGACCRRSVSNESACSNGHAGCVGFHCCVDKATSPASQDEINSAIKDAETAVATNTNSSHDDVTVFKTEYIDAVKCIHYSLHGAVLLMILLTLFLTASEKFIQVATWRIVANTVAFWMVVMQFMVMKTGWSLIVHNNQVSDKVLDVLLVIRIICAWSFPFVMYMTITSYPTFTSGLRMLSGPFLGYAISDYAVILMKRLNALDDPDRCLAAVFFINCGTIFALVLVSYWRELIMVPDDPEREALTPDEDRITEFTDVTGDSEAAAVKWKVLANLIDFNVAGFVAGFMNSFYVRFKITGSSPGSKQYKMLERADVNGLIGAAILAFLATLLWAIMWPCMTQNPKKPRYAVKMITSILIFSWAWLTYFACQWWWWLDFAESWSSSREQRDLKSLTASVMAFITCSLTVFLALGVFRTLKLKTFLLDRAFTTFGFLLIGLSMEATTWDILRKDIFDASGDKSYVRRQVEKIIIAEVLTMFLAPGWLYWMCPRAYEHPEEPEEETKPTEEGDASATPSEPTAATASEPAAQGAEDEGSKSKERKPSAASAGESPQKKPYSEASLGSK